MRLELYRKEFLPSILWFILLLLLARISDEMLHQLGYGWVGKFAAIPGVAIILISFIYSLRKSGRIPLQSLQSISLKKYLAFHEVTAWFGAYLILIHAGIHFHAALPWVAAVSMLISVISGFTGHVLHGRVLRSIEEKQRELMKRGAGEEEAKEKTFQASLLAKSMLKWRKVHKPLTAIFAALAIMHIISATMFFTGWK